MSIARFAFKRLSRLLAAKRIYLTKSLNYRKKPQLLPPNFDYVRYATLALCAEEILSRGIKGNVAELGVYKGDFAKRLNALFKDRKLYLFDTFSGFTDKDKQIDQGQGYSSASQDFSDTTVGYVRSQLTHPENCIFRAGYFPDTATGITGTFCLVSIDADLFEPIFQGLQYFYPRLEKGGYIFVHDVNNEEYVGARQAVQQYCGENGIAFVPIPDSGGTVIISK